MGGIAAIIDFGEERDLLPQAHRMTDSMAYRGPDGTAHWHAPGVAMGYCAMHTTAEARDGVAQPLISSEGRFVALFDGYLFNHAELAQAVGEKGLLTEDRSDAALALAAWMAWGESCPIRLEGEFALVIWDRAERRLFACRDHQGLRPLYYLRDGDSLLLASDISAILAATDCQPAPNIGFLVEIAAGEHLLAEETAWNGLYRILPAHVFSFDRSGTQFIEYWRLPTDVTIRHRSMEDYAEHYREVLADCVQQACRTDRQLALEVSGGLDSTALFSLAHNLEVAGALPAPGLQGYTFDPPAGSAADELDFVSDLEAHVGRKLERVPLFMPDMQWFFDTSRQTRDLAPFANTAMLTTLGERLVAAGSRVVLNGQGGDMWLAGSDRIFFEALRHGRPHEFAIHWRNQVQQSGQRFAATQAFRHGLLPFLPRVAREGLRRAKRTILGRREEFPLWLSAEATRILAERRAKYGARLADEYRQYKLSKLQHPFFYRILDTMAGQIAHIGYEARSPMHSRAFIEFSAQTPDFVKFQHGRQKALHRRALSQDLPQSILERQSKADFSIVYQHHEEDIRACLEGISNGPLAHLFNPEGVAQAARLYCTAALDAPSTWQVWGLLSTSEFSTQSTNKAER